MSVLQNVRLNRFKILTVNSKKKKRKIESNDYNRTSYESHFETISWKIAKRIVNKKTHVLQLPINTDSYFSQFDSEIAILSRNSTREKFHLEFFPRIHGYCTSISHYTKKKKYIYIHTLLDEEYTAKNTGSRGNEFLTVGSRRRQKTTTAIPAAHWLEWSWPSEAPTGCLI